MGECTKQAGVADHSRGRSLPPEVVVRKVQILQCKQEVIEGLGRDFNQLVVVDDQMLQIYQTCQVPGSQCSQAITCTHRCV